MTDTQKTYKPRDFEDAVLKALRDLSGGTTEDVALVDALQPVCDNMGLENVDSCGIQPSTKQPWIRRWLLSTVKGLRKKGFMGEPLKRGAWCLTADGIDRTESLIQMTAIVNEAQAERAEATTIVEVDTVKHDEALVKAVTKAHTEAKAVVEAVVAHVPEETQKTAEVAAVVETTVVVDAAEGEKPAVADAILFAYGEKAEWRIDGTLYSVGDVLERVRALMGKDVPSKFTDALLDGLYALKLDGFLEGVAGKPDSAALSEKGRLEGDRLGNLFFDEATDKLEAEKEPELPPDPFEGEEGSRDDFGTAPVVTPDDDLDGVLLIDSYTKGLLFAGVSCFGENYHPEVDDCQICMFRLECYNAMKFKLLDEAKALPIFDLNEEKAKKAKFRADSKAKKAAEKADADKKALEPKLPPEDEVVSVEDPDLNEDDLNEILYGAGTAPTAPPDDAVYTIEDAERRDDAGQSWKVHLQKVNPAKNEDKFYKGDSGMDNPTVSWGRNGGRASSQNVTAAEAFKRLRNKLHSGYRYVATYTGGLNSAPVAPAPLATPETGAGNLPTVPAANLLTITISENGMVCDTCGKTLDVGTDARWAIGFHGQNDNGGGAAYHIACVREG